MATEPERAGGQHEPSRSVQEDLAEAARRAEALADAAATAYVDQVQSGGDDE